MLTETPQSPEVSAHAERTASRPPATVLLPQRLTERREVVVHGHTVTYRMEGSGPLLLLLHGIAGSSATWRDVLPWLAERYTVVAPDLLGHGQSAKPRGDYSLGAYASGVRDFLVTLGHERATVLGHSLGGGVAMQFAYQFPQRCERLILVDSGGLGHDVNLLLHLPALPGAELVMPFVCPEAVRDAGRAVARFFGRLGLRAAPDLEEVYRAYASLSDAESRHAFIHTVRSVIDLAGQRVSAADRLYLAAEIPTLIIWGKRDPLIPVQHGIDAAEAIEGSRLVVFPNAGHFPHRDTPRRFVEAVVAFMESSTPARVDEARWRATLRGRGQALDEPVPERTSQERTGETERLSLALRGDQRE